MIIPFFFLFCKLVATRTSRRLLCVARVPSGRPERRFIDTCTIRNSSQREVEKRGGGGEKEKGRKADRQTDGQTDRHVEKEERKRGRKRESCND